MIKYYKINEDNSINNGNFNDYFIEGSYDIPLDQDTVNQFKYPVYNTETQEVTENIIILNEEKWKKYRFNIQFLFTNTSWIYERYQKEKLAYDNGWSQTPPSSTIEQIRDWCLLNDMWRKRHSDDDPNFDINNYTLEDISNFFSVDLYGTSTDFTMFLITTLSGNLEELF